MVFVFKGGICFDDGGGFLACKGGEFWVFESFHHKVRDAGLTDAGEFNHCRGCPDLFERE